MRVGLAVNRISRIIEIYFLRITTAVETRHKTESQYVHNSRLMDNIRPANDTAPPTRGCGSCTLCCKVLGIEALEKPPGRWCERCKVGTGCSRYEARPAECRDFLCGFLTMPALGENWRPSVSRLVIGFEGGTKAMLIQVDPDRPEAWKRAPYYQQLKEWSRRAVAGRTRSLS